MQLKINVLYLTRAIYWVEPKGATRGSKWAEAPPPPSPRRKLKKGKKILIFSPLCAYNPNLQHYHTLPVISFCRIQACEGTIFVKILDIFEFCDLMI